MIHRRLQLNRNRQICVYVHRLGVTNVPCRELALIIQQKRKRKWDDLELSNIRRYANTIALPHSYEVDEVFVEWEKLNTTPGTKEH